MLWDLDVGCQAAPSCRGWFDRQLAGHNVGWGSANGQPMRRTPEEDEVRLAAHCRKGPTPNWLAGGAEPRWLSSLGKSVVQPVCQSSGSLRIQFDEEAGTSLAPAVGVHALLCRPPSHEVDREFRYAGDPGLLRRVGSFPLAFDFGRF